MTTTPPTRLSCLQWLNFILCGLGVAVIGGYTLVSVLLVDRPPYDYAILMHSAEIFCYDHDHFRYGVTDYPDGSQQRSFYPAPFYSTFCVPYHNVPIVLLIVWMALPLGLALWLSGGRAAILIYPPLFVLLLLGQSSGWLLLLYVLVAHYQQEKSVRWWHSLWIAPALFKPHIALPAVLYLLYRWRKHYGVLAMAGITLAVTLLPALLIMPDWIAAWLPNGRGFEPNSLASLARVPIRLFAIPFAASGIEQVLVWGFCGMSAALFYVLLRWRRGKIEFYDAILLFCVCLPLINDYDLVILLPFIARRPRLLLLALTASLPVWLYVVFSGYALGNLGLYNVSLLISWALLVARLARTNDETLQRLQAPLLGFSH